MESEAGPSYCKVHQLRDMHSDFIITLQKLKKCQAEYCM
jgi:hypothetical protein